MYRVHAIDFDLGIFTNLSSEHMDFHNNMDSYFSAKMRLFEYLARSGKPAIVNIADRYGRILTGIEGLEVVTYGDYPGAEVHLIKSNETSSGSEITADTPEGRIEIDLKIPGRFNIENALSAIASGIKCGIEFNDIRTGLENFTPPAGRMQKLDFGQPFDIFIDYAHTPDALSRLLSSSREFTRGRLITVFGCGGDRDRTKRAPMARTVAGFSDFAVLTSDNPRTEDAEKILDDVEEGFPPGFDYSRESSREDAIRLALEYAEAGDSVIIAGKGHEDFQIYGQVKMHFSEEEIVSKFFQSENRG